MGVNMLQSPTVVSVFCRWFVALLRTRIDSSFYRPSLIHSMHPTHFGPALYCSIISVI